ncbi:MAG: hypothetical protein AAF729_00775 [Pseudomonadota bacterium]
MTHALFKSAYDQHAQSQDRNHRIGQTEPVTYMRLLAADTIEEAVVCALERKSSLARGLLGDEGADATVAQPSQAEMCELLAHNLLPKHEAADRSTMISS